MSLKTIEHDLPKNPWSRDGINRSLVSDIEIKWEGDLKDDCHAKSGYLAAHCECMAQIYVADSRNGKKTRTELWYCSVAPVDEKGWVTGDYIFHTGEYAGFISNGEMARAICESIIRAHFSKLITRKRKELDR